MNHTKVNIHQFLEEFNKTHQFLLDVEDNVPGYFEAVLLFDKLMETKKDFKSFVIEFVQYRKDFIASDREAATFMFTLNDITA